VTTLSLFATRVRRASLLDGRDGGALVAELEAAARGLAAEDRAGRAWCRAHGYGGYTSYASLDDLPRRMSVFDVLRRRLDREVAAFADELAFDLGAGRLKLDSLWVNVLKPGAAHSGHLHPHSVVSGTAYVLTPPGAGALRLEDPRLPMLMAAPPRRADAPDGDRTFVELAPAPGDVILWESWLRHEVPANRARSERISVSFNYSWTGGR
jgi:uncharacterized protein (TIGR02466 family)